MKIFFWTESCLKRTKYTKESKWDHTEVESSAEFYSEGVLRKKVLPYSVCDLSVYFYTEGADYRWQELPQVLFLSQQ